MDDNKPKTADVWRERIVAWQTSGQSVRGWCKEHGCHEHAFYWWRVKLGLSPTPRKRRRVPKPAHTELGRGVRFAEVVVDRSPVVGEPIRLRLGGGRELVLPVAMPMTDVATLVRTIEGACAESDRGVA
ncbi:MAG: hypothetical protein IT434_02620 [Phycisphaerales bacterium]|nr:hypothetical protein [Phycisphaerales bacterium]